MTTGEIKAILEKLEEVGRRATRPPWIHDAGSELGQLGDVTIFAESEIVACQVSDDGENGYVCNMDGPSFTPDGLDETTFYNADFIILARTALPALREAVERMLEMHEKRCLRVPSGDPLGDMLYSWSSFESIISDALAPLKELLEDKP